MIKGLSKWVGTCKPSLKTANDLDIYCQKVAAKFNNLLRIQFGKDNLIRCDVYVKQFMNSEYIHDCYIVTQTPIENLHDVFLAYSHNECVNYSDRNYRRIVDEDQRATKIYLTINMIYIGLKQILQEKKEAYRIIF